MFTPPRNILAIILGMAISAFSLARPEMEQMLADSNKKPSGWDWCALDAFDYARLPRPWNDVPYAGVNVRAGLCSDGKGTWELYHKQLTLEEVNQRRLAKQGTGVSSLPDEETAFQPYFSLYNPYTGVLRTFLWVPSSGDLSSKGDALVVRARIVEGKNTVATHLLDYYGDGQMISLNESALPIEKYWILSAPENNLWVILDLFLTYDPTDYNGFDGYEKKLDILYEMKLQNSSTLKLDGALTGELKAEKGKKEPDVKDYLTSGASLVSVTSNGWQSIEEAYDSPKELGGKLKKIHTQGNV